MITSLNTYLRHAISVQITLPLSLHVLMQRNTCTHGHSNKITSYRTIHCSRHQQENYHQHQKTFHWTRNVLLKDWYAHTTWLPRWKEYLRHAISVQITLPLAVQELMQRNMCAHHGHINKEVLYRTMYCSHHQLENYHQHQKTFHWTCNVLLKD